MRAPFAVPRRAGQALPPALALLATASVCAAQPAATGAADRYGYAPADAQIPMSRLRDRETPGATPSPAAAPSLRRLSWPGKSAPALRSTATDAPAVAPIAPVAAAPRLRAERRALRPSPWSGTPVTSQPMQLRSSAPSYAPTTARRVPTPPAVAPIAATPTAYPIAPVAAASATGVGALPPPVRPWYQRWPEATAPSPDAAAGVGASLAPAPPAAPPPALASPTAALSRRSAPAAAPVRTAALAPAVGTARYYSLHKPYGHGPDPAPIPPQFFGPTADLSAPETPEPARATLTANASSAKAAVNAARLQQGAAD